ncbi:AglZ/HisF2 family acetamidino modification protein [Alphaproteobacteria bacterium]|nr:AglZ/HisF2 family acetamidino modification protein [Alphaproteobacteria bacterium]
MLRPRITPCLLVQKGGLVKTQLFKAPKYVGDPINAVKIFNEKESDELIVLDIDATRLGYGPNFDLISRISDECRMPLCYGGGLKTAEQAEKIICMGVEKVAISSVAIENPSIVSEFASAVGSQSVVAVIDVREKSGIFSNGYEVCTHNATKAHRLDPLDLALELQELGAGEIILNSVDRDGGMQGYNLELAKLFKKSLRVPMTMLGGAGSLDDISSLFDAVGIVGAAAGSLFVFKGKYRAVLISYPTPAQKFEICKKSEA